ncbi:hypothetical protein [Streptomonospora salina]|uniref:Uncharacterized protein n=1 Tax=Streptomonospora salina TaxID=104205 RepID=A0A841EN54_9ACTN|nr:hypothetical protein [Streptomonospora salina]MBB6000851.1 hypothetical protein [Streptomonospora salina]
MAAQHAANGRIGALESWSRTSDRAARTKRARENSPACFEYHLARVDAEITDHQERVKAAEAAHRAYMLRLAQASAKSRKKKAARDDAA